MIKFWPFGWYGQKILVWPISALRNELSVNQKGDRGCGRLSSRARRPRAHGHHVFVPPGSQGFPSRATGCCVRVLDAEARLGTHSTALNRPTLKCNLISQLWTLGTSWDYSPVCDWTALGDPTRCTRHVVQSASGTRCTFHCQRQPGLAHPVASASRSSDPALVSVKSHWYKGDCIMPEGRYYWGASPYDGRCLFTSLVGRQLKPLTRNSTPCTQNPKP